VTPVKLTAAQARALGIDAAATAGPVEAPARRPGRRRRDPYRSQRRDCGELFTSARGETRHVDATRHARYQLVLVLDDDPTARGA